MKQSVSYAGLSEKEVEAKAIKDCKFYWGNKNYKKMTTEILPICTSEFECRFAMEMWGVQGVPQNVLIKKFAPQITLE